jgi:hypothetical protein
MAQISGLCCCPQINRVDSPARWAAHPQIPVVRGDRSADRRREQHWHSFGLALVPGSDELLSILKHLSVGRTTARRFLCRDAAALVFHLAAVEAHALMPIAARFCQLERRKSRFVAELGAPRMVAPGPGPSHLSPPAPAMARATRLCRCVSVPAQGWALSSRVYRHPPRRRLRGRHGCTKSNMTVSVYWRAGIRLAYG